MKALESKHSVQPQFLDNAGVQAWPEHALLGFHLGPNNNGKKWE
jgi:hypothetical protein